MHVQHNCSSLMQPNILGDQSKINLDDLSVNSTTVIRRAPYWVKYTEQLCPHMHEEKNQYNGRNQSCHFLWPFQCQIHLTEISCFHNSLATTVVCKIVQKISFYEVKSLCSRGLECRRKGCNSHPFVNIWYEVLQNKWMYYKHRNTKESF